MRRLFVISLTLAFTATVLGACGMGVKSGGRIGADAHARWDKGPDVGVGVTLPDIDAHGTAVPGALPGTHAAPPAPVIIQPAAPAPKVCQPGDPDCDPNARREPPPPPGPTLEEIVKAVGKSLEGTLAADAALIRALDARVAAAESKPPAETPPAAKDEGHGFGYWALWAAVVLGCALVGVVVCALLGIMGGFVGKGIRALWRKAFPPKPAKPATSPA